MQKQFQLSLPLVKNVSHLSKWFFNFSFLSPFLLLYILQLQVCVVKVAMVEIKLVVHFFDNNIKVLPYLEHSVLICSNEFMLSMINYTFSA